MSQGVNDATILAGIAFFLFAVGFAVPYINAEFSTANSSSYDPNAVAAAVAAANPGTATISGFLSLLIWTFNVPAWLGIIFLVIRMTGYFILARNIWIGGGA